VNVDTGEYFLLTLARQFQITRLLFAWLSKNSARVHSARSPASHILKRSVYISCGHRVKIPDLKTTQPLHLHRQGLLRDLQPGHLPVLRLLGPCSSVFCQPSFDHQVLLLCLRPMSCCAFDPEAHHPHSENLCCCQVSHRPNQLHTCDRGAKICTIHPCGTNLWISNGGTP